LLPFGAVIEQVFKGVRFEMPIWISKLRYKSHSRTYFIICSSQVDRAKYV